MLRFHERQVGSKAEVSVGKPLRPITSGLRDWRTQMRVEDLKRFEAMVGALLVELGYERSISRLEVEAQTHAATIRSFFNRDFPRTWKGKKDCERLWTNS